MYTITNEGITIVHNGIADAVIVMPAELGFSREDLLPEEFLIKTVENNILILSKEIINSGTDHNITNTVEETDSRVTTWAMKAKYDYWNPQDNFILKWWGIIGEEVDLEGM
jgi:hypothetical protein